jgi:aspartate aminotransferase
MATKRHGLRLAKRLDEVGFSDIVQIRNKVMELRAAGKKVHAFHGGEPFFETPDSIKYAMVRALVENQTRYPPSSGIAPLREALARKLLLRNALSFTPDEVVVTSGGAHGLFAAFQSILDPGDDVSLFSPYWTPIRDMITAAQARPLQVPTASARRNGLTKSLEQFTTPHTRAIYYNSPQNPTGFVFNRAEAEEIAAFARKHHLVVIADEAYEDLVYEGSHFSIAALPHMAEQTISVFTFSKSYAMTGWRVGYVAAHEPFLTGIRKMILYSTNGVSTPTQWAALEALSLPESTLAARREEYRQRRDLMVAGLQRLGFECEVPQGAFYAFPSGNFIHKDSRKAATGLLDEVQVATVPGVVFGAQGEGHLRFSYATSPELIERGLEALQKLKS